MYRLEALLPISRPSAGMGNRKDLNLAPNPLAIDQGTREMSEQKASGRVWAFSPSLRSGDDLRDCAIHFRINPECGV